MLTTIDLVRHAHADWTPDENRPLSSRGRADASALARRLSEPPIDAICSSPARRAIETIEPLAWACGLAPAIVDDLRERTLVVPSGASFEDAIAAAWASPDVRVGGSESNREAARRGRRVVDDVVARHAGGRVVLSTHGNLLALVLNALDPSFGLEGWRGLSFPDAWRLTFRDGVFAHFARLAGDGRRA
ncbi:MAG: histidine phosphatase family protein [Vicinamibacteria bacterium]